MKLSKFATLVKREGCCNVYRVENDAVWLGTRGALFRAGGLPEIHGRDEVRVILSLNEKQMEKIMVYEHDCYDLSCVAGMNLHDYDEREKVAKPAINIGLIHAAVKADDGELIFYDTNYLSPLADELKDSDYMETTIRWTVSGQPYIAVKDGFDMLAAIMPMQIVNDAYIARLQEFEAMCVEQLFRERARAGMAEAAEESDTEQVEMEE